MLVLSKYNRNENKGIEYINEGEGMDEEEAKVRVGMVVNFYHLIAFVVRRGESDMGICFWFKRRVIRRDEYGCG